MILRLQCVNSGAYLGFEIAGANKKNSPVFLIDRFLYTVSYKPILSVIDLINNNKFVRDNREHHSIQGRGHFKKVFIILFAQY